MVSIPVRLHKAARRERIRFRHVYRREEPAIEEPDEESPAAMPARANVREFPKPATMPQVVEHEAPAGLARVRNVPADEISEKPIEKSQVLKGYEISKDRFVTFEPQEVAALRPRTSTELDIAEFVKLEAIDPIFFETSYYAAPDRGGEKAYALLFQALRQTEYVAIGSLAMHGRQHATVIRAGSRGLILHTLFYENEVRADEEYRTDTSLVTAKELELAKTFVRALAAPFTPSKLKDDFEERLRALVEERAESAVETYQRGGPPAEAPVIDIMEALRKSIEMAKKPPQRESEAAAKPVKPKRGRARP